MRAVLTLGALLLVVAGLWWAAASSGDSPLPEATSETPPAAAPAPVTTTPAPTPSEPSRPVAPPPTAANVPPAAPPAAPPRAAAEAPANAPVPPPEKQGPFDRLKEQFGNEPRDSGAHAIEARIQEAFRDPAIPAGVLTAVLCHKTVCKLDVQWTEERNTAWMVGLTHLMPDFSTDLAFSPGPREPAGGVPIEVYWGRKPGGDGH